MKRVAIFTNFAQYLSSYSPLIIVSEQIQMLLDGGYKPVVIVTEAFDPPKDSVFNKAEIKRIPNVSVSNNAEQDPTFKEDVKILEKALGEHLRDIDVVITHDMIFLPDYVKHRVAAIQYAEKNPELRWLHWVHSATSPGSLIAERRNFEDKYKELLGKKFPNSFLVFPNAHDIPRVAKNFGYEEDEVVEVPHPTDYVAFANPHPMVARLLRKTDISQADVIMVYPLRLDRGKQPHINLEIIAACNRIGLDARLIIVDFHSTGGDKVTYRDEMKETASDYGISDKVIFMSEFDKSLQLESPRQVVSDLFGISNFFCLPSMSETYSLVAQEAMLKGNFCILNHDFLPMRSIYGDKAIYKQFSANIGFDGYDGSIETKYGNPQGYYEDIAKYINYVLKNNKVIKGRTWVRKERSPRYIFKTYLEPLLYGGDDESSGNRR